MHLYGKSRPLFLIEHAGFDGCCDDLPNYWGSNANGCNDPIRRSSWKSNTGCPKFGFERKNRL